MLLRKPFPPDELARVDSPGARRRVTDPEADSARVTALLAEAKAGKPEALDALLPLVYQELRRVAGAYVRRERPGRRCRRRGWSTKPTFA